MKVSLTTFAVIMTIFLAFSFSQAAEKPKGVCLKVNGEKVEIHNLVSKVLAIDREGVPDSVPTSMLESISSGKESKSYNLLLSKVKRDAKKVIISFEVKIDDKLYSYPKDACSK